MIRQHAIGDLLRRSAARFPAAVVLREGAAVTGEELVAFLRERLAAFKTPKRVVFVDALPKNASGKVLKRELRDSMA
ncbi:fatty-acyl-CoA synthase [Nonomuraea solani]|uniref:Fatty-acyl-CoA synthase n=1 Tax=Nonomuraea solani TaxID=1144553 RepID=A0A1H6EGY3_9ACTN|nr:fatty-acyl-CoA synthase [Nonomuraea solani]